MSVFCSAKLSIYLVFFYVQLNTLPEISGVVSRIIFIKRYITSRCNWNFGKKKQHKIKSLRFVLMQNFDIKQSKRFQELDSDKKKSAGIQKFVNCACLIVLKMAHGSVQVFNKKMLSECIRSEN